MRDFAIDIARQAGALLKDYHRGALAIQTKSTTYDLLTQADLASEQLIINAINKTYPHHAILAEESGASGQADYQWIVDPLDGTTNFAHGLPTFSVALCLLHHQEPVLAVTYDPLREELFIAEKDCGATLNGRPIGVSPTTKLAAALIATGFPNTRQTNPDNNLAELGRILPHVQGIRRAGSAALDLAYIACGRLDGYWEILVQPWDWLGGSLLIKEAGGLISAVSGAPWTVSSRNILAGNPAVYRALLQLLQQPKVGN